MENEIKKSWREWERILLKSNEFKCHECREIFVETDTFEEAEKIMKEQLGEHILREETVSVCGGCYDKRYGEFYIDKYGVVRNG